MQFEFAAPSALDTDNRSANSARLLNMYREPVGDGNVWCKSLLGMEAFSSVPEVFCRAMARADGKIYLVQGGALYSISAAGVAVRLGSVTDSAETSISSNNGKITVVAGGDYFVWDGLSIIRPPSGAFAEFGDITFFGQLTVLTEKNGRRVQWSGVADPETLGGLDFATTEARDDKILRVMPIGSALWFFKETSIEPWYQSGAAIAAVPGATIEKGLRSRNLATQIPAGAFFVASDGRAYLAADGLQRVSNVAVETSIEQNDPIRTLFFEDAGHKFCVLIFSDRAAWVYNIATGEWCERVEGEDLSPWSARACVSLGNAFYIGTDLGVIAKLGRSNEDLGETMVRRIVSRTAEGDGGRFRLGKIKLQARVGFFDTAPKVVVRMSDDFGMTWGTPKQQSLGERGAFKTRTIIRRLGSFRQATMEVTITDPADVRINAVVTT